MVCMWQWQRQRAYANQTPINGKVIIITGASSGIGKAAAKAFAIQGAHTVLVARRANLLAELQDELSPFKIRVLCIPADLTIDSDIEAVVSETLKEFGRIDVLVNNAGLRDAGYFEEITPEKTKQIIDINLYGATRMIQSVLPIMKAQGGGHIINVSSTSALISAAGQIIYSSTKAALSSLSEGLVRELNGTGVRVSSVMPGWTHTEMISNDEALARLPGMSERAIEVQSAEFVASHIVAAVRYNKVRVILGGWGFKWMAFWNNNYRPIVDWYLNTFYPPEQLVETMRNVE